MLGAKARAILAGKYHVDFDDVNLLQSIVDKWTSLYAATSDKHDSDAFAALPAETRLSARGIEVGHVFNLGTKFSEALDARYTDEKGEQHPMVMGCYGIGVSRVVAAVREDVGEPP